MAVKQLNRAWQRGNYQYGTQIEDLFAETLRNRGYDVRKATREEDIYQHIDLFVNDSGVDVKAKRALNKIWLEMDNVKGEKGWLRGEAEYIAFYFEDFNHFKVFSREDLLSFVEENVTETCKTSKPFMKFYSRDQYGQKDKLVKVRYDDIKHFKHYIVKC